MRNSQKLAMELSRNRQRLNELLGSDEITDEERAELDTLTVRTQNAEIEYRAAVTSEESDDDDQGDDDEGEGDEGEGEGDETVDPELRQLFAQANAGEVALAASTGAETRGATAELQKELGLDANQLPIHMLMQIDEDRAVTPVPAAAGGIAQTPIIPAIFPRSVSAYLMLNSDIVPAGENAYTVLSTSATVRTPGKTDEAAETTGGFTTAKISPSRLQAQFFYGIEDGARLVGMDSALRANLAAALAAKLDDQIVDDLLSANTLDDHDANAADTYASYRKRFAYDQVDGAHAYQASDVRMLVGSDTYSDMAATYRSAEHPADALGALMAETGGVQVSSFVPATAAMKQNVLVRIGQEKDYAVGVWAGVELITDRVTKAKSGEVVLTAVMLYGIALLRAAGFAKVEAQHA